MKVLSNKYLSTIFRIVIGLVFVASAILKYLSIDIFDLFVFEHNLFSISLTETLTRLLITAEFVLGIMLIFNIHAKIAYYTVLGFLAGFTIYLSLLPYLFDVDITNCHCFGNAVVLSRTESIAKNVILLICMLFVSPKYYTRKKWETWLVIALSTVAFITCICINAPNYIYTMVHKENIQIDVPMYQSALLNSGKQEEFTNGKQLICMYSVGCRYCKRAAIKLHLMLKNNQLPEDYVKTVFWKGTPDTVIHNFFIEQKIAPLDYTTFSLDTFLTITSGSMPVILFSDNGNIVHTANYITLKEEELFNFLRFE